MKVILLFTSYKTGMKCTYNGKNIHTQSVLELKTITTRINDMKTKKNFKSCMQLIKYSYLVHKRNSGSNDNNILFSYL